jgi:hypothetical protein
MISREPPKKIEKVRPLQFGNTVPDDFARIKVFHLLAIDVNLESFGQMRNPLNHDPFGPMSFVEKRGNHREATPGSHASHAFLPNSVMREGPRGGAFSVRPK